MVGFVGGREEKEMLTLGGGGVEVVPAIKGCVADGTVF